MNTAGHEDARSLNRTLDPGAGRPSDSAEFPVPGWDRYQPIRLLGQGGMGRVFLARDCRLAREVALKFVRGDDRDLTQRFIREARAQARVAHERVCKVYEVGEVAGRVYIAMQYIDGQTLADLAPGLSIEQKVMLVHGAALGLHEAHKAGLIHRDVKPGNIMVEQGEDGALRPYVMDFGIAQSFQEGHTETGTILGTPQYMAPEQARGDVKNLDRRVDVYALGATLYAIITGEPPIPGESALEILTNVLLVDPKPPRAIDPGIPADLEAIILKCLEKDRSSRYDSARALAEDLERFLDGEPVKARRAGFSYRLRKKAQKHKRLVGFSAVALAAVLVALGWGIAARREASERERLARRYTELVEKVEATARYSALSPAHDIRADRRAIREAMRTLEQEIEKAGPVALGPGHYALGRGFFALGEEDEALRHLASAWEHGYREPRVAFSLALVKGHFYQRALHSAEAIEEKGAREAKRREIEVRYRDPALAYLRQSEGALVPSPEYVAALVAFYEGRFDDALVHLDRIGEELPHFYEAPRLRGDILVARAWNHWNEGRRKEAVADFEAARNALARAAAIGESVPEVHEALAMLEENMMLTEMYGGGDVAPSFKRGLDAVNRALSIHSEHVPSLLLRARLQRSMAADLRLRGKHAEELVIRAITDAERAAAISEDSADALVELGTDYWQWGQLFQDRNQDPSKKLEKAVEVFERVRPEERRVVYYNHTGLVFHVWADYEEQVGRDSLPNRDRAIVAYQKAIALDDGQPEAWLNLGINAFLKAASGRAPDPEGDIELARSALGRASERNPDHIVPYYYGGKLRELVAQRKRARGMDARPDLEEALSLYRNGQKKNPKLSHLYDGAGNVLLEIAREAWDRGADPDPLLAEARLEFEKSVAAAPEQGFGLHNIGEVLVQRAYYARERQKDPGPIVDEAAPVIKKSLERLSAYAPPWSNLGKLYVLEASYELSRGRDPSASLSKATTALDEALRRNPSHAQSLLYLGEARGLRARWLAAKGRARDNDFKVAVEPYEKALAAVSVHGEARVAFGRFCQEWVSWQKAGGDAPEPRACLQWLGKNPF